jgi:hypothetical protein
MGVDETGSMTDRRAFISAGVSGAAALLSGCTSLSSDAKTGIDNSDGDGSNQSRSGDQLEPAQAPGPSVSIDSTEYSDGDGYQCSVTWQTGSADRLEVVFDHHGGTDKKAAEAGDVLATTESDSREHLIFAPNLKLGNSPLYFGDIIVVVAVTGQTRKEIDKYIVV